ncbi:hypothetical protein [Pseudomonas sp. B21-021]|uniref:hypothetical protein n=1 Tax=Pseudomonas sp. B21-021 TaxID=2895476 RepID=UPI002160D98D|nr:hypothetical protein [Pseudomonas sp. B21-021]UVM26831.1 hypothetical protein LOY31_25930 [Pseudomonas sp. B21-021]
MDSYLNATLGTFFTPRMEIRLFDKAEKFAGDTATNGSVLTYFHEHVHYFQTLFTGYGHIQWSSYRQATGFTHRMWEKLRQAMGAPRIPLSNCNTRPDIHQYAQFLGQVFAEQNKLSQARFVSIPGIKTLDALKLVLIKEPWQINPVIESANGQRELCTKDILEGHAFFLERSFAENLLSFPEAAAWVREGISDVYTAAYDWFITECGQDTRSLFPVICDLSLQISWKPVSPTTAHEWQASNPSWRFYLLTKALAAAPEIAAEMNSDWSKSYLAICDRLLHACNFIGLSQILAERLQALLDLEQSPGLSPMQHIMKRAMEQRVQQPWISVNPMQNTAELEMLFNEFRIPAVLVEGRYQAQSTLDDAVVTELIGELHYQAFMDQLLGNPSSFARNTNSLECGFAKYGVHNGCPHQVSGECIGRFDPKEGLPMPMLIDEHGNIDGCTFGAFFKFSGMNVEELVVDYDAKFLK